MQMDVDALKQKVSKEFFELICKAKKGYRPNYEHILEEISFIELFESDQLDDKLSLTTLQYYLNNKWQITQF